MTDVRGRRRRWIAGAAVAGTAIAAVLAFGVFEVQTAFIDHEVAESAPAGATGEALDTVAAGAFRPLDHEATGRASILADDRRAVIRFDDAFATSNGPDLVVVAVIDGRRVELGELKGNRGAQNYALPDGTDPRSVTTVSVWCRRFDATFATATLR